MGSAQLIAFLDTHAAVFLCEGKVELFGQVSRRVLERASLRVSPLVRLELQFLREVGKITATPDSILKHLQEECGVSESEDSLGRIVAQSIQVHWTRDPFDRLIVATALHHHAFLITRDRKILEHFSKAIW